MKEYSDEFIMQHMKDLISILERKEKGGLIEILEKFPLQETDIIKIRLMAGLICLVTESPSSDSEVVQISPNILISLLAEIYRWRSMFGSLDMLKEGKIK